MAHRSNERRETDLGANARNFGHDIFQTVSRMLDLKLAHEVAHHAAGNLMLIDLHVNERGDAALIVAATAHLLPIVRDFKEEVKIESGIESRFLEGSRDHLNCRMGIARGKRSRSRVDNRGACFGTLDKARRGHAANIVTMQMDRHVNSSTQSIHKLLGAIRREQAGHILDADGVRTELGKLTGIVDIGIKGMDRAGRVRNGRLKMRTAGFYGTGAIAHVIDIVQSVEDTEDIDAVLVRTGNEAVDNIGGIMAIANEVLTAHEHRERSLGRSGFYLTKTVPRVLI